MHVASPRITDVQRIGNDVVGDGRDTVSHNIRVFSYMNRGKPQETSLSTVGVLAHMRNEHPRIQVTYIIS